LLPPMPQAPKPISETERPERPRGLYRTVCDYSIVAGELPLGGVVSVQVGALLVAVPDHLAIPVGPAVVHRLAATDAVDAGAVFERHAVADQHRAVVL